MLLNTADIVVQTRLNAGGQHRFSLPGVTDHKKKPLNEGLFFCPFASHGAEEREDGESAV
ncbi:hypothetical protein [Pantoea sp. BAV 3049]|uniref:hypothetical protein n=1 Tax=Pantoea sp. BAV 3049 TaxID=2654188 RepID=UPI00131C4712|nr:hypothetical protein [Pantoea sp. BAV 3049]